MKKKLFLIFIFFGLGLGSLFAQSAILEEVQLKNGSRVRGIVLSFTGDPENVIKLRTSDGSIFVYNIDEIQSIKKYARKNRRVNRGNDYGYNDSGRIRTFESGYRGLFETGYSFGVGSYGADFYSVTTSHGYQFNPYFYLGIGSGINIYTEPGLGTPIAVPLFVNPRVNFLDNDISPYFDAKIGYSFVDFEHFYFNPSIGVSFGVHEKVGLNLSFGYTMQLWDMPDYDFGSFGYLDGGIKVLSGLMLRVGLEF